MLFKKFIYLATLKKGKHKLMSEENKDQLLPEEENKNNADNQEVGSGKLNELTLEEQQLIASEDVNEEKSGDQIVTEIEDHLAKQEEEEPEEKVHLDLTRLSNYSLKELVNEFRDLMEKYPVQKIKKHLREIKDIFDDKLFNLKEEALQKYIEETGSDTGFFFRSPEKEEFGALYREFRRRLEDAYRKYRETLLENQKKKEQIIEEIKSLVQGNFDGSYQQMLQRFKELRNRWHEIGKVPADKYNHLWRTFKHWEEQFYDIIKLDKDHREKLYEENRREKQKIIDRAKELAESDNVVEAFRELQFLHKVWKEKTGPVAPEIREEMWQEFKALTKQIHDKRREYFAKLREEYMQNLEKKRELVARLDEILQEEVTEHKRWQELLREVEQLKERFREIGFVPIKYRDEIRNEFFGRVRQFNKAKNAFYKALKEKQRENLRKKKALIEQVRNLINEEDVKAAYEKCKAIREEWRTIGYVPRKVSDIIWEEFKQACNEFYNHYREKVKSELDEEYRNYLDKKAYLTQLKTDLREGKLNDLDLEGVKEILDKWKSLGHVPENVRYINSKFNRFINTLFYKLDLDENELRMMQFKNTVNEWLAQEDIQKIKREINFVRNKINDIENEIRNAETNLHFFKTSDENNPLLNRLRSKIERQKKQLELWKQKLDYLNSIEY